MCDCGAFRSVARADDSAIASAMLDQLVGSRYTERQAAFMKLCDRNLDIDAWLDEQAKSSEPQRAAISIWLKRMRSVPGSMEDRLSMMSDFMKLADGDTKILNKYSESRRTEQAVELLEMLPPAFREGILQFRSPDIELDAIIDNAWKNGDERLVPRLLNAILPQAPIRVGLNARWRRLGMPEVWHVDEPIEQPEVEIAALDRDGHIDEAIEKAKRASLRGVYERLLMKHGRWDEWLAIDPPQLTAMPLVWSDVGRALVLETLGRHDEADAYYQIRKASKAKGSLHQIQTAQLALITGDEDAFESSLRANAPQELMSVYFLRYQLDRLFDAEGLTDKDPAALDAWLDKNLSDEKPLSKVVRFQSLFQRLGYSDLSEIIAQRLISFVQSHDREQQMRYWDDLVTEWPRYSLESERLKALEKVVAWNATDMSGSATPPRRGKQPELDGGAATIDSIFFKAFPFLRSAARPLFDTLRSEAPQQSVAQTLQRLEDLHDARVPEGWSRRDIEPLFRRTIQRSVSETMLFESIVVDLAETLDAMGMTQAAMNLLQDGSSSHAAQLLMADYAAKLGQLDDAARRSLRLVDQHPDDLNAYLQASRHLLAVRNLDAWLTMQQRTLTRLDGWNMHGRYTQTMRRGPRPETPPEIQFFLELMQEHQPSTWEEIWFSDIYSLYGLSLLSNMYHQSISQHPEHANQLDDMMRTVCLQEIVGLSEDSTLGQPGRTSETMRWDIDWARWCWQYERCLATAFWQAIQQGDRALADRLIRAAYRLNPEQMNTLIDVASEVRKQFGQETLREWFDVYYGPMKQHMLEYPKDTLIANNTAWLAAKCGFEFDTALELAERAVELSPTDTYLDTLAEVEFVRGNAARAIEISERCRDLQPRDPHHRRQIERFREQLNESAPARP